MDIRYVGALLGMGGAYGKALLDMGGVLSPPLLFHSCNGCWACHCRCGRKGKFFLFWVLFWFVFFFFFGYCVLVF